jgi:hypothetical protein
MEGVCDEFRLAMEAIEAGTGERIDEDLILGTGIIGGFGAGWS